MRSCPKRPVTALCDVCEGILVFEWVDEELITISHHCCSPSSTSSTGSKLCSRRSSFPTTCSRCCAAGTPTAGAPPGLQRWEDLSRTTITFVEIALEVGLTVPTREQVSEAFQEAHHRLLVLEGWFFGVVDCEGVHQRP